MKRALIIRHVPVEGIAGFRQPIEAAGFHLDRIEASDPAFAALDLTEPELLIAMGGPMGVYETDKHPWIGPYVERLAHRLERDRPTLGVCLGAQLIAAALGAEVFPGPRKEVGYAPLQVLDPVLAALSDMPVLHWHGDTFTLPAGTERIASTPLYREQGFRRGANVLALQFHAEMGADERFHTWVEGWPHDIAAGGTTAEQLTADHARFGPPSLAAGRAMIAQWLGGLDQAG